MTLWLPTNLPAGTLQGWYFLKDATGTLADGAKLTLSSGVASQWSDASGNGRHLLQATSGSQPSYDAIGLSSGHPALGFNGSVSLRIPSGLGYSSKLVSAFAVGTADASMGGYARLVSFASSGNPDYVSSSVVPILASSGGPSAIIYYQGGNSCYVNVSTGTPALFEGYATSTSVAVSATDGTVGTGTQATSALTLDAFGLGCEASAGGSNWIGNVAEVVIVDGVLSSTDLARIEGYLAWNNGTQGSLATGHAYKAAAPTTGSSTNTGTLSATEPSDTFAATGGSVTSGTLATTEAADTFSVIGRSVTTGSFAVTEAVDGASFVGRSVTAATLIATEGADTAAMVGGAITTGALATTEASDILAVTGGAATSGLLAVTEPADTANFIGTSVTSGALAATEQPDTFSASGAAITAGTLAATEPPDTFSASSGNVISGVFAAAETSDVAAFSAISVTSGLLVATEVADALSATGQAVTVGLLSASEPSDTFSSIGQVITSGVLAASETVDVLAAVGVSITSGILVVTEPSDTATFSGSLSSNRFAVTEPPDVATFFGITVTTGVLTVTEASDALQMIGGSVVALAPDPSRTLVSLSVRVRDVVGQGRARSLSNLSPRIRGLP